jgi:F-type H+-transporting ATPase subunit delta
MTTKDLVRTYARALFDLAAASDAVDEVDAGFVAIAEAIRSHAGLMSTLVDTGMPGSKKREIMREVFEANIPGEAVAIASVMAERGHAALIGDVAAHYRELVQSERGIVVAEVVTAIPLTDQTRESLVKRLTESLGRPVTIRERVDASIIGGIIINVGGRVLDGSLSSQLDTVRSALSTAQQGGGA